MKNQIGIHLSYWQTSWNDNLLPLIDRAHQAGFQVAEFPLLFPADLPYPELKAALDDRGMSASCGTGLNPKTDITHPDPEVRKAGLNHLQACLEGAAQLGSPILGGVTYAPWAFFPDDDWHKRRQRCVHSLRKAASMAEDLNVTLCLEILNRFEGYLLNTVSQGIQLIEEVGSNHLKLHLDTFHLNIEADHLGAEIRAAGSYLGHFHCVANNRKIPGQGHIPWEDVQSALQDIQYPGYLVAETFVNPAGEVGRGMYIWRPLAEDLDEAAADAARFMKRRF